MDGSGWLGSDTESAVDPAAPPGKIAWPRISDYWPDSPSPASPPPAGGTPAGGVPAGGAPVGGAPGGGAAGGGAAAGGPAGGGPGGGGPGGALETSAPDGFGRHYPTAHQSRLRLAVTVVGAVVFLGISGVGVVQLLSSGDDQVAAATMPPPDPAAETPGAPVSLPPSPAPSVTPAGASSAVASVTRSTSDPATPSAGSIGPAFPAGTLALTANAAVVDLRLGRPASGAVRVTTPAGSGLTTGSTTAGTTVTVTAEPASPSGSRRLSVLLDARIAWTIRISGPIATANVTLTGGTVRAVDLAVGADTINLTLPPGPRALPIRMSGGIHTWRIRTGRAEPVRVFVGAGAGTVTLYGKRTGGVAKGTRLAAGTGTGLDIDATGGLGSLTVSAG